MGFFKSLYNAISYKYEVTCKYCGRTGEGYTLREAINKLQSYSPRGGFPGCESGEHEPMVTKQP